MTQMIEDAILEEDTLEGKYLKFILGNEFYSIEIRYVTEIIGIQAITEMPEHPCYIKGIINLRGKIIPVMDVRLRFRKDPKEYNDRTCIVVVDIKCVSVGLIVDSVAEVLSIADGNIVPPPEVNNAMNRYIRSIGKNGNEVILILDCGKLLSADELESIKS